MAEFRSKSPNLTLYMEHVRKTHDSNGNVVETRPSRRIRFEAGRYATTDKGELEFLRGHRFYGTRFVEVDAPELVGSGGDDGNMQREPYIDGEDESDGITRLACDFPGCDYVAEHKDETQARRMLGGHKTRMGHHQE